jgi:transposase
MDWEDRLDEWETELELSAQLDGSEWVTLEKAAAETGVSRAALRTWYRAGQIPSRLVDGPHGPQRLVPLAVVAERAEASPRLRKTAERRLGDEAQLEILRHRVDQLELRLAALERRQPEGDTPWHDLALFRHDPMPREIGISHHESLMPSQHESLHPSGITR